MTKVSKTAMKFLSLAAKRNSFSKVHEGTHRDNLKDWQWELMDAGYIERVPSVEFPTNPFVRTTPAGDAALAAHVAAGGKTVKR